MDAGEPFFRGAFLNRIGYFQIRARQLTSQADGRARVKDITACAVSYFLALFKEIKKWQKKKKFPSSEG